jgi:hypothetical protein
VEPTSAPQFDPVTKETRTVPIPVARAEPVTEVEETAEPVGSRIERGAGYFGIGFGFGRGDIIERSFANDGAGTIGLRFGVIIADQVLLGVQGTLTGQYNDYRVEGDIAGAVGAGMVELTVFPVPFLAWSLGGGAGYAYARTLARDPAVASDVGTGLTWMAATGYDLFAGTGFNLGLQARYQRLELEAIPSSRVASACLWLNWY